MKTLFTILFLFFFSSLYSQEVKEKYFSMKGNNTKVFSTTQPIKANLSNGTAINLYSDHGACMVQVGNNFTYTLGENYTYACMYEYDFMGFGEKNIILSYASKEIGKNGDYNGRLNVYLVVLLNNNGVIKKIFSKQTGNYSPGIFRNIIALDTKGVDKTGWIFAVNNFFRIVEPPKIDY